MAPDHHQNQARQKIRELSQDVREIETFLTIVGCMNKDEKTAGKELVHVFLCYSEVYHFLCDEPREKCLK